MKNLIFTLTSICIIGVNISLTAQSLDITNGKTEYDGADRPAIHVKMEPATKDVKDAWKDYIKDRFDVKLKGFGFLSNKDVLTGEKVTIREISPKEMDFHAKIVEGEYGTDMMVFASLGYDIYLTPHDSDYAPSYNALETVVYDFLRKYLPNHYSGQIEKAQSVVSDLTDNQSDLEKDITSNEEEIEKMKQKIEELKKENEKKTEQLSSTKVKLEAATVDLNQRKEKMEVVRMKIGATTAKGN